MKPHIYFKEGLWWRETVSWLTCAKELKTLARIDLPMFRKQNQSQFKRKIVKEENQ
jgi:hypothetical protein